MNLAQIIEGHRPDHIALWSRGRPTTYAQLNDQVAAVRGWLIVHGVTPGDRVGIVCGNDRFFVLSYLAVLGAGAVAVPLNPVTPGPELGKELATIGAVAVIVGKSARAHWEAVDRARVPTVRLVLAAECDGLDGAADFADALATAPAPVESRTESDLAVLMFTSGTAGAPRAAMLTHGNLSSNIAQSRRQKGAVNADDVVYGVLPLSHIFGLNVVLGLTLAAGATVVLVQRFDPMTALETIVERSVTVIPGAPPMWSAFSQFTEADHRAFATVRLALTGAAKMPEEHARAFEQRFGVPLREGYGLTEASPVVTSSVDVEPRIGSIGVPLPGVQIQIVDTDGAPVLAGDTGEIWVKGPNVFVGYWNDVEATNRALTPDGWLRTGDIAVVDDHGYVSIVDRVKDLIIVSGFNVFPAEVEEVLVSHPKVAEVAVIGVPHPHTGEAVKAFVVLEPGADVGEDELIEFCSDNLARYKCPTKVLFVDELPRGLGGKLLRRVLR